MNALKYTLLFVFAALFAFSPQTALAFWPSDGENSFAIDMFDASMSGDTCLVCDFFVYFLNGMTEFSRAIFLYFIDAFLVIGPAAIMIWVGYRVAQLMIQGGEDGRSFIYSMVSRLTLFTVIYIMATASSNEFLWGVIGPTYLDFAFSLSMEVRNNGLAESIGLTLDEINFGCGNATGFAATPNPAYEYIQPTVNLACTIERAHMMGMTSGVAIITNAFMIESSGNWIAQLVAMVGGMIIALLKVFVGFFLLVIYIMSAIWLTFLILDVVVKALLISAFSPVLALCALFPASRQVTVQAIRSMLGSIITAVGIGVIGVLTFVLIVNIVDVYNASIATVIADRDYLDSGNARGPIDISEYPDRAAAFRVFVVGIGNNRWTEGHVPFDFGTPWFWYIILVGFAIFALGKKMIALLEGLAGIQGESAMADNALKNARVGAGLAMGATFVGAKVTAAGVTGAASGVALAKGTIFGTTRTLAGGANPMTIGGAVNQAKQNVGNWALSKISPGVSAADLNRSSMGMGNRGAEQSSGLSGMMGQEALRQGANVAREASEG